jgi:xylan 1,4-beta-xylosidase
LGDTRLEVKSDSALVTRRKDGALAVAVWNLFLPEEAGSPKTFTLHFSGVKGKTVRTTIVDKEHGSPLPAYEKMGSPRFPSRQQIETLRKAAVMPSAQEQTLKNGEMKLTLQPHSLALIEVAN